MAECRGDAKNLKNVEECGILDKTQVKVEVRKPTS
jgi:hypothetical protein